MALSEIIETLRKEKDKLEKLNTYLGVNVYPEETIKEVQEYWGTDAHKDLRLSIIQIDRVIYQLELYRYKNKGETK